MTPTPRSAGLAEAIFAGTSLAALAYGAPAIAQETPAPAKKQDDAVQLPTLAVQGQQAGPAGEQGFKRDLLDSPKFTAPLLDTPRSITIVPQELLQSMVATTLTDALRTVPGITFGAGEGGNPVGDRPFLRGYDSQSSTFIDGMRDIGAQSREVFNLETIEVTKGPSGAYVGRGGAGGSLNLTNKAPRAEDFSAATVGVGTASYKRVTADVNKQIDDGTAVRINGVWHDADVAGRDLVENKRWGVAPSIAFGLNSDTRATISYYHLETDDVPDPGIPYNNPVFRARSDGRARVLQTGDGSPVDVDRSTFYGLANRDFRRDTADIGTVKLEHDFKGGLSLRNVTRYAQTGQDYILTQPDDSQGNIYYGLVYRRQNSRATEVDTIANQTDLYGSFSFAGLTHNFSTGLEFSREMGENDGYTLTLPTGATSCSAAAIAAYYCTDLYNPNPYDPWAGVMTRNNNPSNSRNITKSAYLNDTTDLTTDLQVNLGLRLDLYDAKFTSTASTAGVRSTFKRQDDLFNYQVGLNYKPTRDGSVYASYATSSTPVGNALVQGSDISALNSVLNASLRPEKNKTFEVGTKWNLFGEALMATAAIFRTETTNSRITQADGTAAMVGEKRVQGVELGLAGKITPEWQVFGGYTYLDGKLIKAGGSAAAFGLADGAKYPNTPENAVSLWTTYDVLPELTVGGGAFYVDKVWGSTSTSRTTTPPKWVPSYWRFDATASYAFTPDMSLQVNVQNLTDKVYYNQAYPTHFAAIAPGRSGTVTLNAKF